MIDKELAITLRKSGLSYAEIAKRLGCSFGWCAKHLVGISKSYEEAPDSKAALTKQAAILVLKEALDKLEAL